MDATVTGYQVDGQSVDSMQLDGEAVLLQLQTHGYFGLNATGTTVWELVKSHPGISAAAICTAVGGRYGKTPDDISTDVTSVLDEMVRQQLVKPCTSPAQTAVRLEPCGEPYRAPAVHAYGDLDALILSGE